MTDDDGTHFFDDRWEYDRIRHFYFLDTPAYVKLAGLAKHCVLRGHRGTGKTTLMRALDWRERVTNDQLVGALGGEAFRDHTVGCFLQIKFLPVNLVDLWLSDSNSEVGHAIISTFLRCTWVIEACQALETLNEIHAFATLAEEVDALRDIASEIWAWAPLSRVGIPAPSDPTVMTLAGLGDLMERLLKQLRSAAVIQNPAPELLVADLDLLAFNTLVNGVFRCLAGFLSRWNDRKPWAFRICMDEGEFLSPQWTITVRTLMRETESPTYLAISVLHELGSQTVSHEADISIDDREIVDLDDRPPEQMASLLAGIVQARLSQGGTAINSFSLQTFLGSPDVDDLLVLALQKSETRTPLALEIKSRAARHPSGQPTPPYVRTHLEENGAILPRRSGSGRSDESVGYRKKKTAGYLQLLGELQIQRPTYAGWRIAVAMSDNSVRDFMRFLRYGMEIWAKRNPKNRTPRDFLAQRTLAFETQDLALKRLGDAKLQSVPQNITESVQAAALIEASGALAHELDFSPDRRLRRPNATRLVFRADRSNESDEEMQEYRAIVRVLRQCNNYGYIADLEVAEDRTEIAYRMNMSLARTYGFSYWKPQYETLVPFEVLVISATRGSSAARSWVARAFGRGSGARHSPRPIASQNTLPGLEQY